MSELFFRSVLGALVLALSAPVLQSSPSAPVELRVSDTPSWDGAFRDVTGVSTHPYFKVRHLTTGTPTPAVKLRIQVALDGEFANPLWDSGFLAIDPTADRELTPAVAYAGPPLELGATYHWRAAVKDSQDVASAFSVPASFALAETGAAADLRATTGAGAEQRQGNPVNVAAWPPSLTAEYVGGEGPVSFAQVQVSLTSDFERPLWDSNPVPVGTLNAGQRTPLIAYTGEQTEPGLPYFWRVRFSTGEPGGEGLWSTATASFVHSPPNPDALSPGGFSRSGSSFGAGEYAVSHVAVGDVTGSGALDAVAVTDAPEGQHMLFPDVGTASPGAPVLFGADAGGRAFAFVRDFNLDGVQNIAIVDERSAFLYVYNEGAVTLLSSLAIDMGLDEPVAAQAADVNWDGWLDLLVAYEDAVVAVLGGEDGFEYTEVYTAGAFGSSITDVLATDFDADDGLLEVWVLSGGFLYLFREFGWLQQEWEVGDATKLSVADQANPSQPGLVMAGATSFTLYAVEAGGEWIELTVDSVAEHGFTGSVTDVVGREVTGDGILDVVLAMGGAVTVWRGTPEGFELHEYVGQPGAPSVANVAVADLNGDTFPDVLSARPEPVHAINFNKPRVGVSISGSHATQCEFGEAFARFEVVLDAAPVSMIEIWVETFEEEGGDGDGDGDMFPDPADFLKAQVSPLPYVPTTRRLVFVPGQTVAWFYVPLTRTYVGQQWNLHARILPSPVGAYLVQSTAVSTVHAMLQSAGAGAPPSGAGMTRDWKINGEVRATVQANGNTYFGGDFDGITWDAQGIAALTASGERRMDVPGISGTVATVATDPNSGDIYVGGLFTIPVDSALTIRNIAKFDAAGNLVTAFAPNPGGFVGARVNAIDVSASGRVYFGGHFTELEAAPGVPFQHLAEVNSDGSLPSSPNHYGVYDSGGSPNTEVFALKLAFSGVAAAGDYLLVGGRAFNRAKKGYQTLVLSTSGGPFGQNTYGNFVGFRLSGTPSWPSFPTYSDLTRPSTSGSWVKSIEVDTSTAGGGTNRILIGGDFHTAKGASDVMVAGPLAVTNFQGHALGSVSTSSVHALQFDTQGRLWVARQVTTGTPTSVGVYQWTGSSYVEVSTQVPTIGGSVHSFAAGPNEILLTGQFSMSEGGALVASNVALLKTDAAQLGARVTAFLSTVGPSHSPVRAAVATNHPTAGHTGYVIGGNFWELKAERHNLAAMDAAGHLLPWAPRTDGPVNAMVADAGVIYFGGAFSTVSGQSRTAVAAAPANDDAQSPTTWYVDVSGTTATVNALAVRQGSPDNFLIIGGDFMTVGGVARSDVAEVSTAFGGGPPTTWNPDLADGAGDAVHALLVDGGRVYIGGRFTGTQGTPRPGLVAVDNLGSLVSWDPGLTYPFTVTGIAATNDEIVFVGDFTAAGGEPRTGAACLAKSGAVATTFQPVPNGSFKCVQATPGGLIYLGGDFITLTEDLSAGAQTFPRRGVAALDTAGNILPWTADVLTPGTTDAVRVLQLDNGKLWVGGGFTGPADPGQHDLTWFSSSWYITTPDLPTVGSDQAYPSVTIQLSETLPGVTWSLSGPAANWLSIDPVTGVLNGTAPTVHHQAPPLDQPVTISATDGATTTNRQYTIRVNPAPPPLVVSFPDAVNNPVLIDEGNAVARTAQWDVALEVPPGQSLSAPMHVLVEHFDGTARWGYEYAGQVNRIVFYPQGQMPAELPPGTIATELLTISLPVTIYGDKVHDSVSPRVFSIRLTSLSQNAEAHPTKYELVVGINDNDPVNPNPEPAYVLQAGVREDASGGQGPGAPADPQGVVSEQPWITWVFGSDVAGEVQGAWQVEVATDNGFGNLVFPGQKTAGGDDSVQVGPLTAGQYFARVRVWDATTDTESDWYAFAFRRNAPPLPAHHLEVHPDDMHFDPSGDTVNTSRPMLTWSIADDPDGDRQHVILHIEPTGGGATHVLDSRVSPHLFEYRDGTTWQPVSQAGLMPGTVHMRLRVPASMALADGNWDWWVDVADPFETTVATSVETFTVSAAFIIEGVYANAADVRQLRLVLLPGHTPIAPAAQTDPLNNHSFKFTVNAGALNQSDVIAIVADPTFDPAGAGPVNEYAAAILRFPGSHLRDDEGLYRKVTVVNGTCLLDTRSLEAINLGHLAPSASPVVGYPFVEQLGALEFVSEFDEFELRGQLRVRGTYAAPGEPTELTFTSNQKTLRTLEGGLLVIEEGAVVNAATFQNAGSTVIHSSALLTLNESSESTGGFHLLQGGVLDMNAASLTVNGGDAELQAAVVAGVTGNEALQHQGGILLVNGTHFANCVLDVGPTADHITVNGAVFAPGDNPYCINWNRSIGQPATMQGISFEAAPSGTPDNVRTVLGADQLTMIGAGGDLAGEDYDNDPGELETPPYDIVVWEVAAVTGLTAHSGDERVLLIWQAGAQTGTGFTYKVYQADNEAGPFTLVDTTTNNFYIHNQLTNNLTYYYYVRITAWTQQKDSDVVAVTPREATIDQASPITIRPNSLSPAAVIGSHTHFGLSTEVSCATAGVTIPSSSMVVLSPSLLLFDIETTSITEGTATFEIETPDVWSEHAVPAYSEQLGVDFEITPPPSPARPVVGFVEDGGAIAGDEFTDGVFLVAVEFDDNNGAPVAPATLQCIVDRDILIGGVPVEAGSDLAGAGYCLWDQGSATGATWQVDQVFTTSDPQEEFIAPGELIIAVRVANEYGMYSDWQYLRIFVNDSFSDAAFASSHLVQGNTNQTIFVYGNDLTGADDIAFDDPEITVLQVTPLQSNSFSVYGSDTYLQVQVALSTHARVGRGTFDVYDNSVPIASGSYRTVLDTTTVSSVPSYPDPLATRAAMNVTLQNGSFSWSATDISAEGRAFPIVWDRSYRSDHWDQPSPLGNGWFGTYMQYLDLDWVDDTRVEDFTWRAPDGSLHRFERTADLGLQFQVSPSWGVVYLTPAGLAVQVYVTHCLQLQGQQNAPLEIRVQTNTGLSYVFNQSNSKQLTSSIRRWYLARVEDSSLNQHTLYYETDRLVRIEGDALSAASGTALESETVYGESLLLDYHSTGLLKQVTRVWQKKESRSVGSSYSWSQATTELPCESVQYWYDGAKRLVLQELPPGTRHGNLYNGYAYEQIGGGPWLLTKIFSPSQVVLPCEKVPSTAQPNGSSFDTNATPSLKVQYAVVGEWSGASYRVIQQDQLVDAAGPTFRSVAISYTLHAPPTKGASGATITQPDGSSIVHALTAFGQSSDVTVSDGTSSYTTHYEYHEDTRATVLVRRPRGDTTFFLYAHDNFANVTGDFTSVSPAGDYTHIPCDNLQQEGGGTVDLDGHRGSLVRLSRYPDFHRYAIVHTASDNSTLVVFGNLEEEGWTSGTIEIYLPNDNPIARYKVIQKRVSPGPNPTPNDFVTTYTHKDGTRLGYYFPQTPVVIDPRGNVTTNVYTVDEKFEPDFARAHSLVTSTSKFTRKWVGGAETTEDVITWAYSDKFGRSVYEKTLDTKTTSEYFPDDAGEGKAGRLKKSTLTALKVVGGLHPVSMTTELDYDARGNLVSMLSPRAFEPGDYTGEDFKTTYFYNDARQLYRVKHPAAGPAGSAVNPEVWTFYDSDGRITREISLYDSRLTSGGAAVPGGNPQNLADSALEAAFAKPTDRRGAGWLHTRYSYNDAGEQTGATFDFDVGKESTTNIEYDIMGRVKRETDAEGRHTDYEYEVRGLVWRVTQAPNTEASASSTRIYDPNGNLVIEGFPEGTLVTHEYDGHNRRIKSTSPAAGGTLELERSYPLPTEPNIIKETWTPKGAAKGGVRRAWAELDELGRGFRSRVTARNRAGQPMPLSYGQDGHPWAVTTSSLNHMGVAELTWAEVAEGQTSSGTNDPSRIRLSNSTASAFGWIVREESDGGGFVQMTYDAGGNVVETAYPLAGGVAGVQTVFDPANNPWKTIDGLGKTTTHTCNNLGWVEKTVDPSGREVETEYNFIGLVRQTKVGSGTDAVITETEYDLSGLTTAEIAHLSGQARTTTYTYDAQGRLSSLDRPDAGLVTYIYDAAGRVVEEVRAMDSRRVLSTYDSADNVTHVQAVPISQGATPVGAPDEELYTYDVYGNLLTAETRADGTVTSLLTMEYNSLDQVEKQTLVVYDRQGQPLSVDVAGHPFTPGELGFKSVYEMTPRTFASFTMESVYDALGREEKLTYWDGRKLTTSYQTGNTDKLSPDSIRDSGIDALTPAGGGSRAMVSYKRTMGILVERTFGWRLHPSVIRIPADRPGAPGKDAGPAKWANTVTSFFRDPRGMLKDVRHGNFRARAAGATPQVFAGVQVRYDDSGNPVFERRMHQGGLSRVMHYDHANRLDLALRGHLNTVFIPGDDLQQHPEYLDPVGDALPHQWRRAYTQDTVDSITGYQDIRREGSNDVSAGAVNQDYLTNSTGVDKRNLIEQRSDFQGQFQYDAAGRVTFDPTTQLSYEHNYRGQVTKVMSGTNELRTMTYDAFGRMVHQVDALGTDQERGTVFIPNIGFGGGGAGADCAGEVSYVPDGSGLSGTEVLQYSYGEGAVAGGIGYKRLLELVAYCGWEYAPYYRFLHEDTMGNTIATTSLFGDRLDEYDYTDYGVPVHAPVALDGRWIESIAPRNDPTANPPVTEFPHISVITLTDDILAPNELIGCELRVLNKSATGPGDVYLTATVVSHKGKTIHVHDENNALFSSLGPPPLPSMAIYNLREGYARGVMDAAAPGDFYPNNWNGEQCTLITVEHGPFDNNWQYTWNGSSVVLTASVGPNASGQFAWVIVMGADTPVTGVGMKRLAVKPMDPQVNLADYTGPGKWYYIVGTTRVRDVVRSGRWASDASGSTTTTFRLDGYGALTDEMKGWILQPDVNQAVYLPITEVNTRQYTVTVAGNYSSLGTQGTRFRIHAPPGTVTYGEKAGVLMDSANNVVWVAAVSSRCLYGGYRYEAPLAGATKLENAKLQTTLRQQGANFAGQHYTLYRHYDPVLMRFTSPDPAASPFYNLHHYAGNNPARYYDPDGLKKSFSGIPRGQRLRLQAERMRHRLEAKIRKKQLVDRVKQQQAERAGRRSEARVEGARVKVIEYDDMLSRFEKVDITHKVNPFWDSSHVEYSSSRGGFTQDEAHIYDQSVSLYDFKALGTNFSGDARLVFGSASWTEAYDGQVASGTGKLTFAAAEANFNVGSARGNVGLTVGELTAGGTFGSHAIGGELGASLLKLDGGLSFDTGHRHGPNKGTKTVLGIDVSGEIGIGAGLHFDVQRGVAFRAAFIGGGSIAIRWGEFDPTFDD